MTLTRRELLHRAGLAGAASMIPVLSGLTLGCSSGDGNGDTDGSGDGGNMGPENLFEFGVASGDPLADAVILWTALSPDADASGPISVDVELATDPEFADIVSSGAYETTADRGWTLKVDAIGLGPATTYYFRFRAQGRESAVGRTRTAPAGASTHLRFGVCSCSNYNFGYFHGYKQIATRADLDAVLHLGDYIYEYGAAEYGGFRTAAPDNEIVSLDDYRTRYAEYRRDPDLQAAHQQHPFIAVWDDHESTNNSWKGGAENHTEGAEGTWEERLAFARQAYDEWMPYREQIPGAIYRALPYGDLVDIMMLDTRIHGRDEPADAAGTDWEDPTRTLLGDDQETWLLDQLSASSAKWKIIGQQVVMTPTFVGGSPFNYDQWDGYAPARDRIFEHVEQNGIQNLVVLTGDIHSSWANDLPRDQDAYDPDAKTGSVGVEFVTPGITSPGLDSNDLAPLLMGANPNVRYLDFVLRGYIVLDVTEARVQADWYHYDAAALETADAQPAYAASWQVEDASPFAIEASGEAPPKSDAPALAPTA